MKLIFWLMLADDSHASARQRNIASGSAIYPSLPPSVILAYDLLWEELMFVAPPPFSCSTIDSTGCPKLMIRSVPPNLSPYFIYFVFVA